MKVRVLSSQPFGAGRCQQIAIGGHECERRETCRCEGLIGGQGCSQLHSIVATQFVILSQNDTLVNDRAGDGDQCILSITVVFTQAVPVSGL